MLKRLALTFLIGGLFGACGQAFIWAWELALGAGNPFAGPLAMATLGAMGFLLHISGLSRPLTELTTMGVTVPTSGMVIAIGDATQAALGAQGSLRAAIRKTLPVPLLILGAGSVVAMGVCIAATAIAGPPLPTAAPAMSPTVQMLLAFAVGGALSTVAEAVLVMSRLPIPVLMLGFMVLGALLALCGVDATPFGANGGYGVSILAAGQGIVRTFALLLSGVSPAMFPTVLAVFVFVTTLGFAAGYVCHRLKGL